MWTEVAGSGTSKWWHRPQTTDFWHCLFSFEELAPPHPRMRCRYGARTVLNHFTHGTWASSDFCIHRGSCGPCRDQVCKHVCLVVVWLFATPWTIAHQAPLFMGFSRQEYWSGVPFSTPGDLPNPGIEPVSLATPALAGGFFSNCCPSGEAHRDGGMTIFPRSKGTVIGLYEDASTWLTAHQYEVQKQEKHRSAQSSPLFLVTHFFDDRLRAVLLDLPKEGCAFWTFSNCQKAKYQEGPQTLKSWIWRFKIKQNNTNCGITI